MIYLETTVDLDPYNRGDAIVTQRFSVSKSDLMGPHAVGLNDPRTVMTHLQVAHAVGGKDTVIDLGEYAVLRGDYWKWPGHEEIIKRLKKRGCVFLMEMDKDQV